MARQLSRFSLAGLALLAACGGAELSTGQLEGSALPMTPAAPAAPGMMPAAPTPQRACRGAPYPLVLAHGMAGFNHIGPVNYFFQVADDLRDRGETVVISQVTSIADSTTRGAQLASQIDQALRSTGACKVNLIAHSQGGLDARYAISTLGYGDRVAALVTVSTPHRGSPVADAALGLLPGLAYGLADVILKGYQLLTQAPGTEELNPSLLQLSTRTMVDRFNPQNRDDPRVSYYSVAGRSAGQLAVTACAGGEWGNSQRIDLLQPLLTFTAPVFALRGENLLSPEPSDGMVPVTSARWGRFLGCVPADHGDEVGQILVLAPDPLSGFSHKELYRRLAQQLHSEGT